MQLTASPSTAQGVPGQTRTNHGESVMVMGFCRESLKSTEGDPQRKMTVRTLISSQLTGKVSILLMSSSNNQTGWRRTEANSTSKATPMQTRPMGQQNSFNG